MWEMEPMASLTDKKQLSAYKRKDFGTQWILIEIESCLTNCMRITHFGRFGKK